MNKLMQQLEDAKHALTEAMDGTDAEAIKSATEAVKAAQAAIDAAKEGEALIASFGTHQGEADPEQPAKSLGEYAVKHLDLSAIRSGAAKSAGTGFGFKAATDVHMSTPIEVVDQNVVDVARNLEIRSLFGTESISGTALKYFVLGATEGAPTTVAQGAQKPQFHIPYDSKTATLQKIAGWYYETDELIEDNAFLRSSIDNRGLFELDNAIESYLMTTLLGTTGIGTIAQAPTADNIFQAIMQVKSASNLDADAIVINPADYQTLRLAKDGGTSGQYYGGGYFYGPYGNGQLTRQPGLWGLNTVVTNAVAAGTVLVGAFRQGATVVTKAGDGTRVEVVTGDHDDRTHNRITVIVEERLALATRVPSAFVKITEAAS
jgi:HK97 family phage major capsid protein